MNDAVDELRDKAQTNKEEIKKKPLNIFIGNYEYDLTISGIGPQSIKLEKYIRYEDIFQAIENNKHNSLETFIKFLIEENGKKTSTAEELRIIAKENKEEIKSKQITLKIGYWQCDFDISGVGDKSIKIEKYIRYEEIIEAIKKGRIGSLEEMLKIRIEEYDNVFTEEHPANDDEDEPEEYDSTETEEDPMNNDENEPTQPLEDQINNENNEIITSVKIGKSYKSKGWALNRKDVLPLLPYSPYEEGCEILVDGIPATGRLNLVCRIFVDSDEEEVLHHLKKGAEKNPNDRMDLTLLLNKEKNQEIKESPEEIQEYKTKIKTLEQINEQYIEEIQKIEESSEKIQEYEQEFEKQSLAIAQYMMQIQEMEMKNKKLENESITANRELRKLKNENKNLKKELEKTPKDHDKEIRQLKSENKRLNSEIKRLKNEIKTNGPHIRY